MFFPTVRKMVINRAAGLASFAEASNRSSTTIPVNTTQRYPISSPARRMIPSLHSYPDGKVIGNVVIPLFNINSFEWATDIDNLPRNITASLKNTTNNYLSISESRSPLTQAIPGTSALLKGSPWKRKPTDKLPDSTIFRGTKYAAIYVSREWNQGLGSEYRCPNPGDLPPDIGLYNIPWNNNFSDCIAVAKLDITAGVTQCSRADLDGPSRSTCLWASNVLSTDNNTASPDPLVNEVFAMVPEIQSTVVAITSYESDILQGNWERFLRNSLIQSYQAGWSAMVQYLSPSKNHQSPITVLEAQISSQRMYIWMGMGMTLVASGFPLMIIQATCQAKTINDSLVAAVMLDSSEVAQRDTTGLCNAVDIGKDHGNAKLRLRLKVSDTSQSYTSVGSSYTHPRLVPDAV